MHLESAIEVTSLLNLDVNDSTDMKTRLRDFPSYVKNLKFDVIFLKPRRGGSL